MESIAVTSLLDFIKECGFPATMPRSSFHQRHCEGEEVPRKIQNFLNVNC